MADVHDQMMHHVNLASTIEDMRVSGRLADKRRVAGLYQWEIDLENFLYGGLNGFSYNNTAACNSGLKSGINYVFDALAHSSIYLPWDVMKFSISLQKVQEAGNTIYA